MSQSTIHPRRVTHVGGPEHYAAGQGQALQQAILRADWATVRVIAADPYTAGEDADAAAGALAGANQPLTVPAEQMSPVELLYAAARAARGGHRPQGGAWVLSRLGRNLGDWLDQAADEYAVEWEDDPECPACGGGSFPCGPHPAIDFHERCQEPVDQCTCIAPALAVARTLLGLGEPA
ncbi:hypothetical protein [Micromonospora chalcea]|uniref:hypothetical protein n=1 Tax=Micromonospora chalcea TaxID=1874 RepID=UPI003D733374